MVHLALPIARVRKTLAVFGIRFATDDNPEMNYGETTYVADIDEPLRKATKDHLS